MNLLNIENLNVKLENLKILNDFNLNINPGETHVIMGPNGAGKSTLANILIGNILNYNITGKINFVNTNILGLPIEEIALKGIFLSFQHPVEIPGLSNTTFFKAFINAQRKFNNENPIDPEDLNSLINDTAFKLKIDKSLLNRSVNEGFSGGEKKRNEILQMLLLNPKLIILDEIDSGLDVDSLKITLNAINDFKDKNKSVLIITHYSRILNYIDVNKVHVLKNGKIIQSGKKELAYDIEKYGYNSFL
ncbi:MAG: Fe-S cluster assembly ATPase SufC [Candidatus Riesia sp.]|nr:Fe-S cluster assembly ATPase SufC [Candidatus Riesia sp.]